MVGIYFLPKKMLDCKSKGFASVTSYDSVYVTATRQPADTAQKPQALWITSPKTNMDNGYPKW